MLDNTHPAVFPPKSNCTLWRYTDLTKFLSLLETKQLYFPRSDEFDDPYEGTWSKATIEVYRRTFPEEIQMSADELTKQMIKGQEEFRSKMYISCWTASEHESAAMWKLYLQSPEGVAIKSNHDALSRALKQSALSARTTLVRYIDYDKTDMPPGNIFFPFTHKRLSFAHETELRAIICSYESVNVDKIAENATSVSIDIEIADLIQSVHVSPTAPLWFGELVEKLIVRYGLSIPVVRSNLYDRPTY